MAILKFKPVTPSRRHLVLTSKKSLWKGKPLKTLTVGQHSTGGRNNIGRSTCIGKSRKKTYRMIDFIRKDSVKSQVVRLEYDPNRSAHIALLKHDNNSNSYILAPNGIGKMVSSGNKTELEIGNCMQLRYIPVGTAIHNIEMKPGKGGQIARSAGSYATISNKEGNKVYLKMRSGEVRILEADCKGTIGIVSNIDHQNIKHGKAGRKRWLGHRPKVRGVAKNPVDHPHGGGEGKSSRGRHPVNKNGLPTKGYKTRKNKRTNKLIFKSRHKT